ncbi:FACT complex subunit SSRP1 [Drosophila subpulchrella]|uniref:FACT complex subunit SSRP1 n=1 Tax=Drosophila subpulchrella TaxID=1486046 RepID=UPI0018A16499|nr:FACT complex subunit SSRP1 [Drosophila subpulchrella]
MESPTSHLVAKDFQVTGVSRSGRVRKKSSKLLDFESPEEIEKRTRRQSGGRQTSRYSGRGRPSNALRDVDIDQEMLVDEPIISDGEDFTAEPSTTVAILNSDDELDNLVQDLVDGVQAEATNQASPVRQSLYMREKANKRKILKDGKVVTAKVQRKDKGKQRYTAYSLWAREARKKDLQDLDFTSATRRLSEMWANVSNRDKNAWRRKAKIQASRARSRDRTGLNGTPQATSNGSTVLAEPTPHETSFQNRATTSRTRKLAADRQQSSLDAAAAAAAASTSTQRRSISTRSARSQASTSGAKQQSLTDADVGSRTGGHQKLEESQKSSIEVIDAAAHLKLLGESLTVIGERLKKHNGYVALSGSLSVLLDSLLCAMGPLLCMTTQIPGLENKVELSKNLADTLDNIAYVMPGL